MWKVTWQERGVWLERGVFHERGAHGFNLVAGSGERGEDISSEYPRGHKPLGVIYFGGGLGVNVNMVCPFSFCPWI